MKPAFVVIVGPTAVGKTEIAVRLAKLIGGEIISGDSVQVYRKLNIGSAKVTPNEQQGVPHHMIDILNPDEEFSVAMFQKRVKDLIVEITVRGKIPLLVGGTGLYIRSIIDPYEFPDIASDNTIRDSLREIAETAGKEELHRRLAQVDPVSAARLHVNDVTRVVRALEVFQITGSPFSEFQNSVSKEPSLEDSPYRLSYFGLTAPREEIYFRINRRVDTMIDKGFVQEVNCLLQEGYSPNLAALQTIGYRHVIKYLRGHTNLEETLRLLKRDTRHFAKRQLTWFRRDPRIVWFDAINSTMSQIVEEMAERICKL
ncbi:MAG TPA: tRNA (adenosine(37)-N6)-dimethylallyltransferase MiaA [Candidatus Deferrimicrobium sp.]|nr:tRNA (adenosine(37)-N6)-dimethylallyltransferase MiaA [Candidatus Deferrimicrobium sp.]